MTLEQWHIATLVSRHPVCRDVAGLRFSIPTMPAHESGQYCEIRLTAPNGYQAVRSYSLASTASQKEKDFGIQLIPEGEVSPYLFNLQPGKRVEIRGPFGGHFVWKPSLSGDLLVVGGGSGVVPLMSMLRSFTETAFPKKRAAFVISAKTEEFIAYAQELQKLQKENPNISGVITLTKEAAADWHGLRGRLQQDTISHIVSTLEHPNVYICGSSGFVEHTSSLTQHAGVAAGAIRVEMFN